MAGLGVGLGLAVIDRWLDPPPDGSARLFRPTESLHGEEVVAGFRVGLEELFG